MTRLGDAVTRTMKVFLDADLSDDAVVADLLDETSRRRRLDLSDLAPAEQVRLVASRASHVLPGERELGELIGGAGRQLVVKFGIDPTAPDVHLGHVVPMIALSRFQRMGHQVVFIVGDVTAKIGDPSGRSAERPPLTDAEIAANLQTYRAQVTPFFDFSHAHFRRNSEWLADIRLPRLIEIMARIPMSMSLQREDFRERLATGQGLAMSEFIYSVVMAIDSAEINADIEVGGSDQLLNMQMGRKVMEAVGLRPQHIVAMPLIAGTDGSGLKMSKSARNYVGLQDSMTDVYGKIMSIPDDLIFPYARAWTEWDDAEIRAVEDRLRQRTAHPMDVKKILAGEMVSAIRTTADAAAARAEFAAKFSRRRYHDLADLVALDLSESGNESLADVLVRILEFAPSVSAARRLARQNGLRVVVESDADQRSTVLDEASLTAKLAEVVARAELPPASSGQVAFLKAGRKIARIRAGS